MEAPSEETDLEPESQPPVHDQNATRITPDQEEYFCDWFQDQPIFYDQRLRDFKNRGKRDRLLQELAKELGLTSTLVIYHSLF